MALSALENAPTFYSAVENAVNTASMKSAPAQQWLSTIANSKGVKPEELDWTGLKDYLGEQEGPVSKQQVQDYLQANKVQLQEVNKGVPIPQPDKQVFYKSNDNSNMMPVSSSESVINPKSGYREDVENGKASWIDENGNKLTTEEAGKRAKDWEDFHNARTIGNDTKYSKYQLPGGENYSEKLLTLPDRTSYDVQYKVLSEKYGDNFWEKAKPDELAKLEKPLAPYKSSHWDEPNILAHVRMNERNVEGKQALHIEEIQSDWHHRQKV